jgi:ubiquinone/menaquinone biosynthesis C-methylase UbiE
MRRRPLIHPRVFSDPVWAEGYARREGKRSAQLGRKAAEMLRRAGFQAGRLLDVGCGPGTFALELARAFPGSEVVGIDLAEPLVAMAREAARAAGLDGRVVFEVADVQRIPFPDDAFDALTNLNMLHIVEDPVAMLDEMERILKPDGYLLAADIRRSFIGWFEPVFRTAWTMPEAKTAVGHSRLRPVHWWRNLMLWGFSSPPMR